jgi:hypothetical protein
MDNYSICIWQRLHSKAINVSGVNTNGFLEKSKKDLEYVLNVKVHIGTLPESYKEKKPKLILRRKRS